MNYVIGSPSSVIALHSLARTRTLKRIRSSWIRLPGRNTDCWLPWVRPCSIIGINNATTIHARWRTRYSVWPAQMCQSMTSANLRCHTSSAWMATPLSCPITATWYCIRICGQSTKASLKWTIIVLTSRRSKYLTTDVGRGNVTCNVFNILLPVFFFFSFKKSNQGIKLNYSYIF